MRKINKRPSFKRIIMEDIKKKIQDWWNSSPCCSKITQASPGTKEFYEEVDSYKNTYEYFIDGVADYKRWKDKRILEIGCGLGKDFSRFAQAGADATGIDMSFTSIGLTKRRLGLFGLKGNLYLADAENLPFKSGVFDMVFSWGVLHHTPGTETAVNEIHRVLKTNGKAIIMLYGKHSLLGLYYSFRFYLNKFLDIDLLRRLVRVFMPWKWFKTFVRMPEYLSGISKEQLLAALTDGFGNPLSKVYSRPEAKRIFSKFKYVDFEAYESRSSCFMRIFRVLPFLEKRLGWFMVIKADK